MWVYEYYNGVLVLVVAKGEELFSGAPGYKSKSPIFRLLRLLSVGALSRLGWT